MENKNIIENEKKLIRSYVMVVDRLVKLSIINESSLEDLILDYVVKYLSDQEAILFFEVVSIHDKAQVILKQEMKKVKKQKHGLFS